MINVAIADRQRLIRESLATLVSGLKGCQVVGLCATGETAIKLVKQHKPDILLMDMLLPGVGALEVLQRIAASDLRTRSIVIGNVTKAVLPTQMLQAGALSFLTPRVSSEELDHAIRKVFSGQRYLCEFIGQRMLNASLGYSENSRITKLTRREFQVLLMLLDCQQVNEIARSLHLSPKTVNSYRYRLFKKLSVKSNVELVLLAVKSGIPAPSFDSEEVLRQSPVNRASLMLVAEEDTVFLSSDPD